MYTVSPTRAHLTFSLTVTSLLRKSVKISAKRHRLTWYLIFGVTSSTTISISNALPSSGTMHNVFCRHRPQLQLVWHTNVWPLHLLWTNRGRILSSLRRLQHRARLLYLYCHAGCCCIFCYGYLEPQVISPISLLWRIPLTSMVHLVDNLNVGVVYLPIRINAKLFNRLPKLNTMKSASSSPVRTCGPTCCWKRWGFQCLEDWGRDHALTYRLLESLITYTLAQHFS